ncbi:hypothetical protein [Streptomyces sp. NPDC085596]|uniref:hypothetical protein n=1 Tax=Streptomyces sp. NPDC085596 TaxID=3365731 RepID=UPI0037D7B639
MPLNDTTQPPAPAHDDEATALPGADTRQPQPDPVPAQDTSEHDTLRPHGHGPAQDTKENQPADQDDAPLGSSTRAQSPDNGDEPTPASRTDSAGATHTAETPRTYDLPGIHQNIHQNDGTVVGVQNINEIRRLRGTPLPAEWIAARLEAYVPDDEQVAAITQLLSIYRVAVIHAPAGTGRYTTALHVLADQKTATIRQMRREPDERTDLEGLKDEDTGWILDLRDEEETLHTGAGHHLREVETHLRTTRSYLVVVTHPDAWARVADEASELAHPLKPAHGLDALRAHLSKPRPGIDQPETWCTNPKIKEYLNTALPAEAARWARIIRAAVALNAAATDPEPVTKLVEAVISSTRSWRSDLLEWHTAHTNSSHRNYLLTTAVLDGAPAETIYTAHGELGQKLNDTPHPTDGQQGPGIIELTHTIGADLTPDDRICFRKPGYAEAVVDYFWVDRPHHAAAFTQWTAHQAASLPSDLGSPLAERVTQWATRYTLAKRSFTILRAVATHWASSRHLQEHAQDLLVAAAVDPTAGRPARDRYLAWAKAADTDDLTDSKNTPTALKKALAGALAQLGPAYPKIALKRLSELAVHTTDSDVANAVGDALTTLWDQPTLQDTIRATLTSWYTASQPHHTAAARRAFLHLASRTSNGTTLLLHPDSQDLRIWALNGWRCALNGGPSTALHTAFTAWLDAALANPDLRPAIITTFTEAVVDPDSRTYLAPRFLTLNHAAYRWEPAHEQPNARTQLRDELLLALREADPAPAHPHAPTTA